VLRFEQLLHAVSGLRRVNAERFERTWGVVYTLLLGTRQLAKLLARLIRPPFWTIFCASFSAYDIQLILSSLLVCRRLRRAGSEFRRSFGQTACCQVSTAYHI